MEGDHCILVLEDLDASGAIEEERSEVSRAQGEVLLDVCAGKTTFERISLDASNGVAINVERFTAPVAASFVEVTLPDEAASTAFRPPIWMGMELAPEDIGDSRRIALGGKPKLFDGPIHNAALESLLDLLDHRAPRYGAYRSGDDPMMSALRRLVRQPGDQAEGEQGNAPQKAPGQSASIVADEGVVFDVEAPANGSGKSPQQPVPRLPIGSSAKPRA
jgi:hypothetical protein